MADESNDIKQNIVLNYRTNADQTATEVNVLANSVETVNAAQAESTAQTKKNEQGLKTFKTQLREANQELLKVSQTYGEASKEAVNAAKKVADLKDQMQFSKDLVDKFNPDQKFKALGAATQIAATATSGLVSGMALFGDQSEATQKQLLKVQAAMAFSDAISGLSDLGDQWKTLKTVVASSTIVQKANAGATMAAAAATRLFGGAVDTGSKSFKGLKLAISATGIGLLVTGLALVVNNFDKIKEVVLKVVPGLEAVGETVMSIVNAVTDFIGVTSEADRELDKMKEGAAASIALNKKFLAEHGSQLDEFTKQKIAAKDEYNEAIQEDGADQVALGEELNRKLAKIEYSRGDEKRKIQAENLKKEEEERKKASDKAKEDAKKLAEENLKEFNEFQIAVTNAKIEQNILDNETEIENTQRQIDELNALADKDAEIDLARLKNEQDIQEARVKNEQDIQEARVNQDKEILDSKIKIAEQGVQLLTGIFGKSKAVQKAGIIAENAIGIAKMVIANNAANIAALATPQAIATSGASAVPVIALNNISTGIGIASTVAATAKALKSVGGGSAGGSSSSPVSGGGGAVASSTPKVDFQASSENQIANSITSAQKEQPPIQTYVVSKDVTDAQNLDNNKITSNSLGG